MLAHLKMKGGGSFFLHIDSTDDKRLLYYLPKKIIAFSVQLWFPGYQCIKTCSSPWHSTTPPGLFGKRSLKKRYLVVYQNKFPFKKFWFEWDYSTNSNYKCRYNLVLFHPSLWQKESQVAFKFSITILIPILLLRPGVAFCTLRPRTSCWPPTRGCSVKEPTLKLSWCVQALTGDNQVQLWTDQIITQSLPIENCVGNNYQRRKNCVG